MATLDIFNDDAFSVSQLSQTIVDIPRVPTLLGDMGLFRQYGITTTSMMIERKGKSLSLVPSAPRGGIRQPVGSGNRKLIPVAGVHLPQSGTVMADEVQNVRAFGSETEVMQVQNVTREKLAVMKEQADLTLEYHRVGAVKGKVLDADGSEILDVYDLFGMNQETVPFNIATSNSTVDLKAKVVSVKRKIREALGGRASAGTLVICSEGWFDKFTGHDKMAKAWERWQDGAFFRQDQSEADFAFAGVTFRIYSGGTSAGDFIPDGEAFAIPLGVPGMFQQAFAPADYMETVNTMGAPYYAKQERMKFDRGVELESQTNPITLNTLPEATLRLTTAAT